MELFDLITVYFGLDKIAEAQTFPELLQAFLYTMFALYLVVFLFRAVFSVSWRLQQTLSGRR
ncbi:MAG: hypothetical protein HDR00_09260 [Lachnospiraceae bacterium]|nr:hypothetical protein [Lachnospiraceae bacterium]